MAFTLPTNITTGRRYQKNRGLSVSRYIKKPWFLLILLAVALLATVYKLRFSNADALWKIVSQQCVPLWSQRHNRSLVSRLIYRLVLWCINRMLGHCSIC